MSLPKLTQMVVHSLQSAFCQFDCRFTLLLAGPNALLGEKRDLEQRELEQTQDVALVSALDDLLSSLLSSSLGPSLQSLTLFCNKGAFGVWRLPWKCHFCLPTFTAFLCGNCSSALLIHSLVDCFCQGIPKSFLSGSQQLSKDGCLFLKSKLTQSLNQRYW